MSDTRKQTVLLVDGYSLIFRGFHALPLLTAPDGTYTNAVHGFFSMLIKALGEYRPDGLCVMMDMHAPTFRHTLYDGYKATRKPMPEELRPQLPLVRKMLEAMHVRICELEGYEADDLLGTAARLANERGIHAYVLTGDRDSLQLVGGETEIILTRKGITESLLLDAQGVYDTYGFTPAQVPDMKGLMGDASDNIPGIPGIGEKTALKLITQYGSLDGVLEHADQVKGKLGEKLRAGRDLALLSRELGTICRSAPLEIDFDRCRWDEMALGEPLLEQYGLKTISRSIAALLGGETPAPTQVEARSTAASRRAAGKDAKPSSAPAVMAVEPEKDLPSPPPLAGEQTLTTEEGIRAAAQALLARKPEWLCLCQTEDEITLLAPDMLLRRMPILRDLTGAGLYDDKIYQGLKELFSQAPFVVHGAKALWRLLDRYRLPLPVVKHDTMIAAYLLHTAQKDYSLPLSLSAEHGGAAFPSPTAEEPSPQHHACSVLRSAEFVHQNGMSEIGQPSLSAV